MQNLTLQHKDFRLSVECTTFSIKWEKAGKNIAREALVSDYQWTQDENEHPIKLSGDDYFDTIQNGDRGKAFFFENTNYSVWVDFLNTGVKQVELKTDNREIEQQFQFHHSNQVFVGFLNYHNDIGRADLCFRYQLNSGEWRTFTLTYEVLSTKLDYHSDWQTILSDIESEYHMLAWDYMRQTYHNIGETEGNPNSLTWWSVFRQQQDMYIAACKNILSRPRHRLRPEVSYMRADKIQRFTPQLEQEFSEHKSEYARLYRVEEQVTSHDTLENRFFKYTVQYIAGRFEEIAEELLRWYANTASESLMNEIEETRTSLRTLVHHPFFRTVGTFKGLRQESQILQRDANYSTVFRTYQILRKSFSLQEGLFNMQTKDIATLYEIWCLIQVSHIVRDTLGDKISFTQHNRPELHPLFVSDLKQGNQSAIIYKQGDVELAKVVYNPKHTQSVEEEDGLRGIDHLTSRTVNQKPDIVLQLTKDDMIDGLKLTYLFDAKYRIKANEDGSDVPPDDAINQMHRYRDAIYYASSKSDHGLKKEVIGGYILFPGKVQDTSRKNPKEKPHFLQTVDEVGIGAFPLRPDKDGRSFLEVFIQEIIGKPAVKVLTQSIPQKGLRYEKEKTNDEKQNVLIGYYKGDDYLRWINDNLRYVVRAGEDDPGAVNNVGFFNVQYVVLVGPDKTRVGVYATSKHFPRVVSGQRLKTLKYPTENPHDAYYSFSLRKYDPDLLPECDHKKIRANVHGGNYGRPEVITLAEYKRRTLRE